MKATFFHPLAKRQLAGSLILLLVVSTMVALRIAVKPLSPFLMPLPPPMTERTPGSKAIQVELGSGGGGVYFFEGSPSVIEALRYVAPEKASLFDGHADLFSSRLSSGDLLSVSFDPPSIRIDSMEQWIKYALGIPMDADMVTAEDLSLIPGIGPATAEAIVKYRERQGGLRSLSELINVPGVGDKRCGELKRYLALDR